MMCCPNRVVFDHSRMLNFNWFRNRCFALLNSLSDMRNGDMHCNSPGALYTVS